MTLQSHRRGAATTYILFSLIMFSTFSYHVPLVFTFKDEMNVLQREETRSNSELHRVHAVTTETLYVNVPSL